MIQQTISVTNRSCEMAQYKQESLILNITANKAIDTDKK